MIEITYKISHWIKEKAIELIFGGGGGVATTIIIDWNHIAEKAIEVGILAGMNGGVGTFIALIVAHFVKKILKKYEDNH